MSLLKLPPTRLDRFADSLGFHLRRAHEAAQQRLAGAMADTGLLPIHAEVLCMIGDNPDTIPSVIASALGRDRSSITGILRTLLDRGLIARARTMRDRRAALLRITPEGEAVVQQLAARAAISETALDRVLGEDKPAFLDQLRRIQAALAERDRSDEPGDDL